MAKQNKGRKFFATTATAALVASAIVPVASAAELNDFNQVPQYAKEAVQFLVDSGAVQGDQNGNFKPFANLTRAQAAEILTKQLGLDAAGSENYSDVNANNWFYNAVVATSNEGIFQGNEKGEFLPNKALTRQEAAVVIVNAFGLEGSASLNSFADAGKVPAWAKAQFETAVANGVINGKGALLAPQDTISNAEFATMIFRAVEAASTVAGVESVTAINNTTVEVNFDEKIEDINSLKFAIEGLEVTNAAVKQTDSSVAVLTTAKQEGGKEYTVTLAGQKLGTFKGVSAVVPTAVKISSNSQQGIVGKEITARATVEVAEGQSKAGIPVTFNIAANETFNKDQVVEVFTNADGVAEYSYTQYAGGEDQITAYATGNAEIRSTSGIVYWGVKERLTIESGDSKEYSLANGEKKVYKVTYRDAKGNLVANQELFVAFKENVGVKPNEVIDDVTVTDADGDDYPFQVTTGGSQYVKIETDEDGEATFTLTGTDASVTPIVFENSSKTQADVNVKLESTELQAEGKTVKFDDVEYAGITIEALGTANASWDYDEDGRGGRDYKITVKDTDGKPLKAGSVVKVYLDDAAKKSSAGAYMLDEDDNKIEPSDGDDVLSLTVDKDGEAEFTVYGEKNGFATPVVFIDRDGDNELSKGDYSKEAEITYFTTAVTTSGAIEFSETKPQAGVDTVTVTYKVLDQNGKALPVDGKATFEVKNTALVDVTVNPGNVKVHSTTKSIVRNVVDGEATITLEAADATKVTISVNNTDFHDIAGVTEKNVKDVTETITFSTNPSKLVVGAVTAIDASAKTITLDGTTVINLDGLTLKKYGSSETYTVKEFLANVLTVGEEVEYFPSSNTVVAYDTDNTGQTTIDKANQEVADTVIDAIDALDNTAATYAADVAAARDAYDDLTADQKALVTNYADLQAAEAELNSAEAVQDVIDAIDALDNTAPTYAADVAAARDAYDDLTAEEKALVTNYADLQAAENELAQADAEANALSVIGSFSNGTTLVISYSDAVTIPADLAEALTDTNLENVAVSNDSANSILTFTLTDDGVGGESAVADGATVEFTIEVNGVDVTYVATATVGGSTTWAVEVVTAP